MSDSTNQTPKPSSSTKKKGRPIVADSWEDEADNSSSDTEITTTSTSDSTSPLPPPAVQSSTAASFDYTDTFSTPTSSVDRSGSDNGPRQAKTDAVARRMIANALGVRPQRSTKEQKEYEESLKKKAKEEKEEKRRLEMEREKAKRDVWGD